MDEELKDYINCPICYGVPENEIFQCPDGHTVCEPCSRNLVACPQCRVPYGARKIRNRALEAILNCQEFECQFRDLGCAAKFSRKYINSHIHHCQYNVNSARICKYIGFPNCTFAPGFNRAETIAHFREHGVLIRNGPVMHISIDNFSFYLDGGMDASGYPEEKRLLPTLLNLDSNGTGPLFLILSKITTNGFMTWTCIHVWKNDESRGERCSFFIVLKFKNVWRNLDRIGETTKLEYVLRPILDVQKAEPFLNTYPLQIPTALIYEKFWDRERNCINIYIRVGESEEYSEDGVDTVNHLEETWILCPNRGRPFVGLQEGAGVLNGSGLKFGFTEFSDICINCELQILARSQFPEVVDELRPTSLISDEEAFPALPSPLGSFVNSTQMFNGNRFGGNHM
ncbi:unnamed protein product [Orchesella dallaii]|uniref:RING-type domain-containing protein n=1 Tax=Orchesella dallaii TaxID=48710 RepID=A0ABP1QYU5_9HEXA